MISGGDRCRLYKVVLCSIRRLSSNASQSGSSVYRVHFAHMRIAMVTDAWDDTNNGGVISTRRFVDLLRARGHTVVVLATGEAAPGKVPLRTFVIPTPGRIMEKM